MPGEAASTAGGELRLGVLTQQSAFVISATPRLLGAEKVHLMEQDFFPTHLLEGANYHIVVYSIADFPDRSGSRLEAFVDFAKEVSQGLGERALAEEVKYIQMTPK